MELPPEEQIQKWIGLAARKHREDADVKRSQIAAPLGLDGGTVGRFERAETWPQNVNELLTVYAEVTDAGHPREIWATALKLWAEHEQQLRG